MHQSIGVARAPRSSKRVQTQAARAPRGSKRLRAQIVAGACTGAVVGYTLAAAAQARGELCLCSALSGGLLGAVLPYFASDEEMQLTHWLVFACATLLAAAVMLTIAIHSFNPAMLSLCPFCGQPFM
jgi:hypothetical protein